MGGERSLKQPAPPGLRAGLVASLDRPGGNITGVNLLTSEVGSKRLELLRELVPKAATIAVLVNPNSAGTEQHLPDVQAAARSLGRASGLVLAAKAQNVMHVTSEAHCSSYREPQEEIF